MPAAQHRTALTLGHSRRGLVRRSALDQLGAIWNSEALAAIQYGRAAARLIQFHFPEFYAEHIAQLDTAPRSLLGVVQAFFSLAQQRLWLDPSDALTIDPNEPLRVLVPSVNDEAALKCLEEFHGWGLDEVCPEIYGLPGDLDVLFDEGRNLALAMLWYLAEPTAWASPLLDIGEVLDYWIGQVEVSDERVVQLNAMPQLPPHTDMERLCAALTGPTYGLPLELNIDLGVAVRFAFSRTGNWFADISAEEVAEMGGAGIDWFDANLDELSALQQEARSACDHYLRLNDFVTSNPNGIAALAGAIWAAAEQAATTEGGKRAKAPETSSGA
jgi:hypothetical protein